MTDVCMQLAGLARKHGVPGLELEEEWSRTQEVTATEDGSLGCSSSELAQRYVRTAGDHVGYARSEDASEPLEDLAARAVAEAGAVDLSDPAGMLARPRVGEAGAGRNPELEEADVAAMTAMARRCVGRLTDVAGEHSTIECMVRHYACARRVSNSEGLSRLAEHAHYMVRMTYIASGKGEQHWVQCRSFAPSLDDVDVTELVGRTKLAGEASLDGGTVETGDYPVVISRDVMNQVLVGMWSVFGAEKVATGQSFLAGKLGSRVASPALGLAETAEPAFGGPGCLGIDCEGVVHGASSIVEKGTFVRPVSNLEWAVKMGLPSSTANANRRDSLGRIVPNDVFTAPGNLYVVPGTEDLDGLVAKAGDGVYLTDISDIYHSFSFASGGVSTPCRGVRIRNGKLAEPISAVAWSDSLQSLFANVVACGNAVAWFDMEDLGALWCGSPDVLVSSMHLAAAEL